MIVWALLFRIAGSYHYFGGQFENDFLHRKVDWVKDKNIRGELKDNISDTLTAEFRASYTDTRGTPFKFIFQPITLTDPNSCFLSAFTGGSGDANLVSRHYCANNAGQNTLTIGTVSLRTLRG